MAEPPRDTFPYSGACDPLCISNTSNAWIGRGGFLFLSSRGDLLSVFYTSKYNVDRPTYNVDRARPQGGVPYFRGGVNQK